MSPTHHHDRQRWLRNSLLGNSAFSTISGLIFAFGAAPVASFSGIEQPLLVGAVGAGLLFFAGFVAFVATRPAIDPKAAMAIVGGDLAWVVGTVPIVLLELLSANGILAAIAIADVVLVFAGLQYYGVRRLRGGAPTRRTVSA